VRFASFIPVFLVALASRVAALSAAVHAPSPSGRRALLRPALSPAGSLAALICAGLLTIPAPGAAAADRTAALREGVILVYGDSISANYGLPQAAGWVALLQQRLKREAPHYTVVNASVTGETASGGARRIGAVLTEHRPSLVILELGGNDGLRGVPTDTIRRDLAAIVDASRKSGARVLLLGMSIPPNYGPDYAMRFSALYATLAKEHRTALVPFLFEGFGEQRAFFQSDGIHPTAAAQPKMLDLVWAQLRPMLRPPAAPRQPG
jgi:acyl-CoA thioesterase-1